MAGSVVRSRVARPFPGPPPPRTPKAAGTRRLLLAVAAELFVERGYHAVSMRDIASAAGLTKGALYGHFRSKGQLLVEVIRSRIADAEGSPGFAQALADPDKAVGLMFDEAGRQTRLLEVDAAAAARHDADVAAGLAAFYRDRQERIQEAVSGASDPEVAAWTVAALAAGVGAKESVGMPLPPPERLRSALLAALRAMG